MKNGIGRLIAISLVLMLVVSSVFSLFGNTNAEERTGISSVVEDETQNLRPSEYPRENFEKMEIEKTQSAEQTEIKIKEKHDQKKKQDEFSNLPKEELGNQEEEQVSLVRPIGQNSEEYVIPRALEDNFLKLTNDDPRMPSRRSTRGGTKGQVTLYTQNFNSGGSIPSGWLAYSEGPDNHPWEMVLDSGSDYRAECNSDAAGSGTNITEWLYMDSGVDCSGYTNLQVQFYLDYDYFDGDEYARVLYSTSSTYPTFTGAQTWNSEDVVGTQVVDISGADGDSDVYIAFIYHGTWDYWMGVDDVVLKGDGGGSVDLVANSVSGPASCTEEDTIGISRSFSNTQTQDSGTFLYGLYLSTNDIISTGDTQIYSYQIPDLTAGATNSLTIDVALPAAMTGTYYYGLIVDINSEVVEDDENNNIAVSSSTVTINPSDDAYEPNNDYLSAYDLTANEQVWLSSIAGYGIQADNDWFEIDITPGYERLVVDLMFTHADGDIDLAVYDSGNNFVTGSGSVTDNEGIDYILPGSGTHYLYVYYGNAGNTYDMWWDDLYVAGTVDLVADSVSGPASCIEGDTIGILRSFTNTGSQDSGTFLYELYLSTNNIISTGDTLVYSFQISDLTSGSTNSGTINVDLPAGLTGTYYFGVILDVNTEVSETDEDNNWVASASTVTISPSGPDLVITDIIAYSTYFDVQISNLGNTNVTSEFWVDIFIDPASPPTVGQIGGLYDSVTLGLNAGQNLYVTIPHSLDGTGVHTIYEIVDTDDLIAETTEDNNIDGPHSWDWGGGVAKDWTFLVYLDADNNLESAGIDDFLEMATVGSDSNINIVVEFDRISGYTSSYGDWTSTKRFYITSGLTPEPANALSDLGELDMGSSTTLSDFITWGMNNYPANHYAVILWNHGSGWKHSPTGLGAVTKSVCSDSTSGNDLSLADVESSLATSYSATGLKLDLIGFDACLMAMVEVDYQVKNYGEVLVSSEELEPGDGWPYDTILSDLAATPTMSPTTLGSTIVTRYIEDYGTSGDETQSAVNLSHLVNLANAVNALANELITEINTYYFEISSARSASEVYGQGYGNPVDDYIDLYDFANEIYTGILDSSIQNAAQTVMNAVSNAVIAEEHGSGHPDSYGISIYFPQTPGEYDGSYTTDIDFTADTSWDEFLEQFHDGGSIGDAYEIDDVYTQANLISSGSTQTHSIHNGGSDIDWVFFTISVTSDVVIETSGPSGDTRIWLYDSTDVPSTHLAFDDDGGSNLFSLITMNDLSPNTYYIKVDEYWNNEEILTYYIDLTVTAVSNPIDLVADSVSGPASCTEGDNIGIPRMFSNSGAQNSGTFLYGLYLSTNNIISTGDTQIYSYQVSDLLAGESNSNTINVNLPAGLTGTYYYGLIVDVNSEVSENNENNNRVASPGTVTISPAGTGCDLVITAISGDSSNIYVSVSNQGVEDVTSYFYVDLFIDPTSPPNIGEIGELYDSLDSLIAGQSTQVTLPHSLTGTHTFYAIVDTDEIVAESDENNNIYGPETFDVGGGGFVDLTADFVLGPSSCTEGDTIDISRSFSNIGTLNSGSFFYGLYLSADDIITTGDILIYSFQISDITAGNTNSITIGVDLPAGLNGTFYYGLIVDIFNDVSENSEVNNVVASTSTVYISPPSADADWTIILYLDADNNLDYYWASIPDTLTNTGSNTDVQILVLYDGDSSGDTHAYHILPGSKDEIPLSNIHGSWSDEVNMGDPDTLIYFSEFCMDNYPADHYLIILQDHGGAWVGCCWDDTNSHDYLSISELKTAFSSLSTHIGRNIDLVFFNDCSMSTIDIAAQIYPYSDFMVGSETVGWTSTWTGSDYNDIINIMKSTPSISPQSLSIEIVNEGNPIDDTTYVTQSISAIDLSKVSDLVANIDALASELINNLGVYQLQIQTARTSSDYFQGPYAGDEEQLIDLYDFADNIYSEVPDSVIQNYASNIKNDIGPTGGSIGYVVIKERHTSSTSFCHGLSLYFPLTDTLYRSSYTSGNDFCSQTNWDEFLQHYYNEDITGDAYEPDNVYTNANLIASGSTQTHSIHDSGSDIDWIFFTLSETSDITIETSGPSGDTRMWLFNSSGVPSTHVAYDDDGGANLFSLIYLTRLPAGTYYVKIDEYGNNDDLPTYYVDLTVTQVGGTIDLVANFVSSYANCTEGDSIDLVREFTNSGTQNSGIFSYGLYLSTNNIISTGDTLIYSAQVLDLAQGASNNLTIQAALPLGVNGTFYLGLIVDIYDEVAEDSENNNSIASKSTITISPTLGGDAYEPDDIYTQASPITPGSTQMHSIHNSGLDVDWVNFTLSVTSDVVIETSGNAGDTRMWLYDSLSVPSTHMVYDDDGGDKLFSRIVQNGLPAGTYYVLVDEFDNNNEIPDYNISLTVTVVSGSIDIVAGSVSGPSNCNEGDTIAISRSFSNNGIMNSGTFLYSLYMSSDDIITTGDTLVYSYQILDMNPQETSSNTIYVSLPGGLIGTYYYGLIVDVNSEVLEDSEVNNAVSSSSVVTICRSRLNLYPVELDFGAIQQNQVVSLGFYIENFGDGTLTWSIDEPYSWITVIPTSGSTIIETDMIIVEIDSTGLSDGMHLGSISISSNGGSGMVNVSINIDKTAPTISVISPQNGSILDDENATVEWTASDGNSGIHHYEVRIDTDPWIDVGLVTSYLFLSVGDGNHTVDVVAYDNASNAAGDTVMFTIDSQNPFTSCDINGNMGDYDWYIGDVTVTLYPTDSTTVINYTRYRVNSESWKTYNNPFMVSYEGINTVEYYSMDEAGNLEPVQSVDIKIDRTQPNTSESLSGVASDNNWFLGNVTITLLITENASGINWTIYRIDGGEWNNYTSSFIVFGEGIHTVEFSSADFAGNIENIKSIEIKIDETAPITLNGISGIVGANGWYISDVMVALFPFDTMSNINYTKYRIDGNSWVAYSGPITISGEGEYCLEYYSIDLAGNIEIENNISVKIDPVCPTSSHDLIGTQGTNLWFIESVTVTLTAYDTSSGVDVIKYRIDGSGWSTYSGSFIISGDGEHTMEYYSVDEASNIEAVKYVNVKIDTVSPSTMAALSGGFGDNDWYVSNVGITLYSFDGTSGINYTVYRINYDSWETYTQTVILSDDGDYYVEYYSVDYANIPDIVRNVTFKIDSIPPSSLHSLSGSMGINGWYISNVTVGLSSIENESGLQSTNYRVDSDVWEIYTAPFIVSGDGMHEVEYYCVDIAGNIENIKKVMLNIDLISPLTNHVLSGNMGGNEWYLGDVTVFLLSSDDGSGMNNTLYRFNPGNWNSYDVPFTIFNEGVYTIEYYSIDFVGNVEQIHSFTVRLDKSSPSTGFNVIESSDRDDIFNSEVNIELTSNDELSGPEEIVYRINGGPWQNYTRLIHIAGDGEILLEFVSKDVVGNEDDINSYSFKIDSVNPYIVSTSPENGDEEIEPTNEIMIKYSEPVNTTSIESSLTINPTIEIEEYVWNEDKTILRIKIPDELEDGKQYNVTLSQSGKDLAGNHMDTTSYIIFSTKEKKTTPQEKGPLDQIMGAWWLILILVVVIILLVLYIGLQRINDEGETVEEDQEDLIPKMEHEPSQDETKEDFIKLEEEIPSEDEIKEDFIKLEEEIPTEEKITEDTIKWEEDTPKEEIILRPKKHNKGKD